MAKSVLIDDNLFTQAQDYAELNCRSIPQQIENWAEIGRIAEDNPDLPYEYIRDVLLATAEIESAPTEPYVRRKEK